MLKFDRTHQSIDENIDKKKGLKTFKRILALGLAIAGLVLFSGCSRDASCDINEVHAHKYISGNNLVKYLISEKETIDNFTRTDDYVVIKDDEQAKLLEFLNSKGLMKIEGNREAIEKAVAKDSTYIEFEYYYMDTVSEYKIATINGESGMVYYDQNYLRKIFSLFPKDTLTGRIRLCYHLYSAYKIEKDEEGNYYAEKSPDYKSFDEIPPEYDYVDSNFSKIYHKYRDIDYEEYIVSQAQEIFGDELAPKENKKDK